MTSTRELALSVECPNQWFKQSLNHHSFPPEFHHYPFHMMFAKLFALFSVFFVSQILYPGHSFPDIVPGHQPAGLVFCGLFYISFSLPLLPLPAVFRFIDYTESLHGTDKNTVTFFKPVFLLCHRPFEGLVLKAGDSPPSPALSC